MFRSAHAGAFLIPVVFLIFGRVAAQEAPDFHQFTDKKGQTVSALLLGISNDRQQMKIRREDGQEFETVINLLSLDDQQYVKDWMKNASMPGAMKTDFTLHLGLTRQTGSVEKQGEDYMVLEGRPTTFRMAVRNLSRDSLEGASLEYAVVWEDRTTLFQTAAGTWTYTTTSDEGGASHRVKQGGEFPLESLRFNAEMTAETVPVKIEKVFLGGTNSYQEDEMIGVKVRILTKDGLIVHEADSGGALIAAMEWEDIQALPAPIVVD